GAGAFGHVRVAGRPGRGDERPDAAGAAGAARLAGAGEAGVPGGGVLQQRGGAVVEDGPAGGGPAAGVRGFAGVRLTQSADGGVIGSSTYSTSVGRMTLHLPVLIIQTAPWGVVQSTQLTMPQPWRSQIGRRPTGQGSPSSSPHSTSVRYAVTRS